MTAPAKYLRLLGVAAIFVTTGPAARSEETGPSVPALHFQRLTLDATGERPGACLYFDKALDPAAASALLRSVTVSPDAKPAGRVQDKAFCLDGLAFDTAYRLTVGAGFRALDGSVLTAPVTLAARFGDRPAHVAMVGSGYILPQRATQGLGIESVNVASVRVHVFRVSAHAQVPGPADTEDGEALDLSRTTLEPWTFRNLLNTRMREIWHGTMAIDGVHNRSTDTAFPISSVIGDKTSDGPQKPGLYLVTVENAATPANRSAVETALAAPGSGTAGSDVPEQQIAARWVNLSDLGLAMLRGEDGLSVAVRSLATGSVSPGVDVSLVARNGDVLEKTPADAQGMAHFAAPLLGGKRAHAPAFVLAEHGGNDFGFLRLDQQWFDFSDRAAVRTKAVTRDDGWTLTSGPRALVQPDRGIYRPGETVRLLVLVRDAQGRAVTDPHATLVLRRPDEMEVRRIPLADGQDGGFVLTLPLDRGAPSGVWHVEILGDPTLPPIGRAGFEVKDFVPQVIAALFDAPAHVVPGQSVTIAAHARFLYGAPGAGLQSENSYEVIALPDPVPGHAGWSFGLENENTTPVTGDISAPPADQNGTTHLVFTPDIPRDRTQPLAVAVKAGFLDPVGRKVGELIVIPVQRSKPLIGLHVVPPPAADAGQVAVPVEIAGFAPDGRGVPLSHLHWTLARVNTIYNWSHSDDTGWTFTSHTRDVPMRSGDIDTDAQGRAHVAPMLDWGTFRLAVVDPASGAATSTQFDVGWGESGHDTNTPDRLPLTVRDTQIAPGGGTVLHIGGGIAGRALVTLATDKVISTQILDVPQSGRDVSLTATPEWGSGVYALVTLYRPLHPASGGGLRPHDPVRAVGLQWIGVDQGAHRLAVRLDTPGVVLPRHHVEIPITVGSGAAVAPAHIHVAVAAVDQGILGLTHFAPIDLFDAVYGKPALGVDMLDNYGALLLSDARAGRIRFGGDAGGDEASGPPVHTTRSVALFDGPVSLDAQGRGSVGFDVPDFDGQLHLMAAAWSPDALGNAQADITVRDPVFPEIGLPRFLAPDDRAHVMVSIVNATAPEGRYSVSVTTHGAVRTDGPATVDAVLAPGHRMDARIGLVAAPPGVDATAIGHITLTLRRAGSATPLLVRDFPIGIRAGHVPVTLSQGVSLPPGQKTTLGNTILAGIAPRSARITLGLSAINGIDTIALRQSLQTSLWGTADDLAAQARALLQRPRDQVQQKVAGVIDALFDLQDASGAIGQWSRDDGRSLASDLDYLADFLIRARDAGYAVPEDRLGLLLDHIESTQLFGASQDGPSDARTYALDDRAYATYVLARAGRLHPDAIRTLSSQLVSASRAGRTVLLWADAAEGSAHAAPLALGHLATSLALDDAATTGAGRLGPDAMFDAAIAALGPARSGAPGILDVGYRAYVRDLAGLSALAAEGRDETAIHALIGRLERLTLDPAALTDTTKTALLEAVAAANDDVAGRAAQIDGRSVAMPAHLPLARPIPVPALQKGVSVANTGSKSLYTTLTLTGTPAGAVAPLSNGLTLSVSGFTLTGMPLDLSHLRQNDRFIVRIDGGVSGNQTQTQKKTPQQQRYEVAVTQLLPAGWEIERVLPPQDAQPDASGDTSGDTSADTSDENDAPPAPYAFLGALNTTDGTSARDDRFTAGLTFDARNPDEKARGFHVAYIARAITPGHFLRPEILVQAHGRPDIMARTASGVTDVAVP